MQETINIVVVGDANTGKTSLLRIAQNQAHPGRAYYKTTHPPRGHRSSGSPHDRRDYTGIVVTTESNGTIQVRGEDTVATQEGMDDAQLLRKRKEIYGRRPDIFVVCCSLDDKTTFNSAQTVWFPELQQQAGQGGTDENGRTLPIVVIVATKKDRREDILAANAPGGNPVQQPVPSTSQNRTNGKSDSMAPDVTMSPDAPPTPAQDEPAPTQTTQEAADNVITFVDGQSLASSLGAYAYYEVDLHDTEEVQEMLVRMFDDVWFNHQAKPIKSKRGTKCQCTIL